MLQTKDSNLVAEQVNPLIWQPLVDGSNHVRFVTINNLSTMFSVCLNPSFTVLSKITIHQCYQNLKITGILTPGLRRILPPHCHLLYSQLLLPLHSSPKATVPHLLRKAPDICASICSVSSTQLNENHLRLPAKTQQV